ncbi:MAG TPA: dTDP-4-dehydrorhamnose reductase [Ilumatobacteraceae bacterium]|nr:dTDP-4-dehydrorhamnose reductase [Ilumatobacteraceae bacterium]
MKVLVTGARGQLGHDVVAACVSAGDDVVATGRAELDVTARSDVAAAVATIRPDVVFHCAAWTAVDDCESDPDKAFAANAEAVRWVREASELAGAHLVTISTDYVFDGTLDRPYREGDTPNPRSVYGRSKLAGEGEAGPNATVVRTSWVCGEHGSNMVRTVLRLASERDTLSFVDDQRGCPTFTTDLAPMLRRLALERRTGIHHVTNQGAVSWYEFVRNIVAAIGKDPAMVRPIRTADLDPPRAAERPANGVLDNAVLREAGLPLLRDHREPLAELVARLST